MNDKDLFTAILLAVIARGETGSDDRTMSVTYNLFLAAKRELENL